MALVHVEDGGRDPRRRQRADAADPQQDLLADPHLAVASVEHAGDVAGIGGVAVDVGVQQQQGHAAHLDAAQGRPDEVVADPHLDHHGPPVGAWLVGQRQVAPVGGGVALPLAAVRAQRLAEVAAPVEQPHPRQRHAQVGGRLQVVAGQDAEAARVERDARVEAELEREVGHPHALRLGVGAGEPAGVVRVGVQAARDPRDHGDEALVGRRRVQAFLGQAPQQGDRVLGERLPALRVEAGEQLLRLGVPRGPDVARDLAEPGEALGQRGVDVDLVDLHADLPVAEQSAFVSRRRRPAPPREGAS